MAYKIIARPRKLAPRGRRFLRGSWVRVVSDRWAVLKYTGNKQERFNMVRFLEEIPFQEKFTSSICHGTSQVPYCTVSDHFPMLALFG